MCERMGTIVGVVVVRREGGEDISGGLSGGDSTRVELSPIELTKKSGASSGKSNNQFRHRTNHREQRYKAAGLEVWYLWRVLDRLRKAKEFKGNQCKVCQGGYTDLLTHSDDDVFIPLDNPPSGGVHCLLRPSTFSNTSK